MTTREAELKMIESMIETYETIYNNSNWFRKKFNNEIKTIPNTIQNLQDYKEKYYKDLLTNT